MGNEKANEVLAVFIVFFVLSWVTVILRIWVRSGILKAFGRDDWIMVATQIVFTAYLACQLGGVIYGTGRHLKDLVPWRAERALSYWFFCEVFYLIATVLMKISIGLFLLRVAVNQVHVLIIRALMLSTAIFGGAFVFVVLFQCWPITAFWTLNPDDGRCINADVLSTLTYAISGTNVFADWTFAVLPVFMVKDLQIPKRRKIMVVGVLAFATVGSTATIIRMPFIWSLKESSKGWNGDFLYDTVGVAIWTTVEVGVGITAGCMATLWPLVQRTLAKFGVRSTHQGTYPHPLTPKGGDKRGPPLRLDGLASEHGVMTVISSCRERSQHSIWRSQGSSQEHLAMPMPDNITKHVTVAYDEIDTTAPGRKSSATSSPKHGDERPGHVSQQHRSHMPTFLLHGNSRHR